VTPDKLLRGTFDLIAVSAREPPEIFFDAPGIPTSTLAVGLAAVLIPQPTSRRISQG